MVPAAHPYPEIPKVLPHPRGYRGQLIEITLVLQDDRVQVYDTIQSTLSETDTLGTCSMCPS